MRSIISDKPVYKHHKKAVFTYQWQFFSEVWTRNVVKSLDIQYSSLHNLFWQILAKHRLNLSFRNWRDTTEQLEGKVLTKSSSWRTIAERAYSEYVTLSESVNYRDEDAGRGSVSTHRCERIEAHSITTLFLLINHLWPAALQRHRPVLQHVDFRLSAGTHAAPGSGCVNVMLSTADESYAKQIIMEDVDALGKRALIIIVHYNSAGKLWIEFRVEKKKLFEWHMEFIQTTSWYFTKPKDK